MLLEIVVQFQLFAELCFCSPRMGLCRQGWPLHCDQVPGAHIWPSGQCWQGQTFGSVARPWADRGILPDLLLCLFNPLIFLSHPTCLSYQGQSASSTVTTLCSIPFGHPRLLSDHYHFPDSLHHQAQRIRVLIGGISANGRGWADEILI